MQPEFDIESYNERLNALFSRFQSVQKVGFTGDSYKPGLGGMERLSALLGDPCKAYPCVHVAGTNGKGSVCSMLAAALAAGEAVRRQADGDTVLAASHPRRAKGPSTSHKGSLVRALPVRLSANGVTGRRIGLYTSPHLLDFRERMKIVSGDGFEMISCEEVWEFLNVYEKDLEGLSFFEVTTGMAFWWFARQGIDAAVIEAGLGGRLDSTNIITPVLSVVTSIGLDHCAILGSTRSAIAREKAGIFKPGVPAVVGVRDPETAPVFEEVAASVGSPLVFASDVPACGFEQDLLSRMDLTGPCQNLNLHAVLVALGIISKSFPGDLSVDDLSRKTAFSCKVPPKMAGPGEKSTKTLQGQANNAPTLQENEEKQDRSEPGFEKDCSEVLDAIAEAGKRTGLWGRWQRICEKPEVICDIGHNPPALKENFARLEALQAGKKWQGTQAGERHNGIRATCREIIIVYGIMADKDLAGIAPLMPTGATYILTAPDSPRSMPAEELKARLTKLRPDLNCVVAGESPDKKEGKRGSVAAAIHEALSLAQDLPNPLIYMGGSTFVVAEALPLFNENTGI